MQNQSLVAVLYKLKAITNNVYSFYACRILDPMRDIGRGDLDPLGRGGGGMLFNPPFNNPNILQPRGPDRNPLPGLHIFKEIK